MRRHCACSGVAVTTSYILLSLSLVTIAHNTSSHLTRFIEMSPQSAAQVNMSVITDSEKRSTMIKCANKCTSFRAQCRGFLFESQESLCLPISFDTSGN